MPTIRFESLASFGKEFDQLKKKFRTLPKDLERLKTVIALDPTGPSQNRTVLHREADFCIVKGRLACQSLGRNTLRVIYAYHADRVTLVWIELYHKADKANEDRARWEAYVQECKKAM